MWHKQMLNHYGEMLKVKLRAFYEALRDARAKLVAVDFANLTGDHIWYMTEVRA